MRAPERIETARLLLRRPLIGDVDAIFARYATDSAVTKYLIWPTHTCLDHTRAFIGFSDAEWDKGPVGPYLIESRKDRQLLGGTGLAFESPTVATTGYVFARDAWGCGYATEALSAMVELAGDLALPHLYALCHPEHTPSQRVLTKCGFQREAEMTQSVFPNLNPEPVACLRFRRELAAPRSRFPAA